MSSEEINNRIVSLMAFKDRNIMINTSNALPITQLKNYVFLEKEINNFEFIFNTNGGYTNNKIGVDYYLMHYQY